MPIRQDKVELPNGKVLDDYFVYEQGDVALIVPVLENGDIMLVRQYTHGVKDIVVEVPAGYLDKGEDPKTAAQRELLEETGLTTNSIEKIGHFSSDTSKMPRNAYIFLARNCKQTHNQKKHQDDNEDIETLAVSFDKVREMIISGEIYAASTIAVLYLAAEKLKLL